MATMYSEGKVVSDEIGLAIRNAKALIAQARSNPTSVVQTLDALAASTATARADIDAAVLANPSDTKWVNLKAEIDGMVQDFLDLHQEATALKTAVESVPVPGA